jgi:hypothetical protein
MRKSTLSRRTVRVFAYISSIVMAIGLTAVVSQPAAAAYTTCSAEVVILARGNHQYVSARIDYSGDRYGMLRAVTTSIGAWERFSVCHEDNQPANVVALRASARASAIGPWERYILDYQYSYTIYALANNRYVSDELGQTFLYPGMLRARATVFGPWEDFSIY